MLPKFPPPLNNSDPVNVNVANQIVPTLAPKSVVSSLWQASGEVSIPASQTAIYLLSLVGYNKGAAQWLHIFDAENLPSDGSADACMILNMPANSMFYADIPFPGLGFVDGLVYAVSTTEATLTLGAADIKATLVMRNIAGGI